MVGLIGAMQIEVENLISQVEEPRETRIGMDTFVTGRLFGQEAVLAVCGPGKVNAALCTQNMILHFHPEWILNLGAAGAGESGMHIGDMVVATCAVQHDMDTSSLGDPVGLISKLNVVELPCDEALRLQLVRAAESLEGVSVHQGVIATGDQFVDRSDVRERIHGLFHAKAVEMEGAAVAHACYVHGVPCGVLRSISDGANEQSDMDFMTFARLAADHSAKVVEIMLNRKFSEN